MTRRTTRKPVVAAASDTDDPIATSAEADADETIKPLISPTKSKSRATKVSKPATTGRGRKAALVAASEAIPDPVDEPAVATIESEPEIEVKAPPTRRATRAAVVKKPVAVASSRPMPATTKRSRKVAESVPSSEPVTETEQEDLAVVALGSEIKADVGRTIRSKLPAVAPVVSRARAIGVTKAKTPAVAARAKKAEPVIVTPSDTDQDERQGEDEDQEDDNVPMQVDQPDPERMRMIDTGAKEARSVIESLDQATPTKAATSTQDLSLTDEQAEMTVVEYIRAMYVAKHRAIKVDGEAKIRLWEERAKGAREVVQGMRCRDQ
jgi:hypothetical protein